LLQKLGLVHLSTAPWIDGLEASTLEKIEIRTADAGESGGAEDNPWGGAKKSRSGGGGGQGGFRGGGRGTGDRGGRPPPPLAHRPVPSDEEAAGLLLAHGSKANDGARPQLPEAIEVGLDDLSDLGIAADGLTIDAEDDALAVAGDLHGAGADGLGDQLALGQ